MSQNNRIYRRGYRIRRAYWATFVVIMSYARVYLGSKIFGQSYWDKRINALHLKNANRVKAVIMELQGLFVKIGQLLSILSNFLPEAFQEPLESLQNKIPARPFSEINARITQELGQSPHDLFEHFNETPIAAASIGQAHKAILKDGTVVVVKVQHANIEQIAEVDLHIIQRIVGLVSWFFEIEGLHYAYTQVRKMIEEELDFEQEASAMQQIKANLKDETQFEIPQLHPQFSTKRVMTTTFYEGVKISDLAQLDEWKIDRRDLANRLVHAYCQMIFTDGFYHADPHPGNIMVQQDGTIVLLDFGASATLKAAIRQGFLQLIEGAVKNDSEKIIAALTGLGFIADEQQAVKIAEKVINAFRHFLQNEVQFEGLSLTDIKVNPFESSLFKLIGEIGLRDLTSTVQVPKDYVLLNRTVTLLMGICNTLDQHMNPIEVIQPYFENYMLGKKGNWVQFITKLLQQTTTDVLALPNDFRNTLTQLKRGEIEVKVAGIEEQTTIFYQLGQQFIYAMLLIAACAFAYVFYKDGEQTLTHYASSIAGLFGVLLLRVIWKSKR